MINRYNYLCLDSFDLLHSDNELELNTIMHIDNEHELSNVHMHSENEYESNAFLKNHLTPISVVQEQQNKPCETILLNTIYCNICSIILFLITVYR